MGTASFAQMSFLGGEWSPQMQGRFDREDYRQGMNVCLNVIPIEEGAAPRRSGTRLGGATRNGVPGNLLPYTVSAAQPFNLELTPAHLRIWVEGAKLATVGSALVITGISSGSPAKFTSVAHGLATGDQVTFTLDDAATFSGISQVLGRQIAITVVDADTFQVRDAVAGAPVDGSRINFPAVTNLAARKILDRPTPYAAADLEQIRAVQNGVNELLLHGGYPPQALVVTTATDGTFESAEMNAAQFYDGPYLDIPIDGSSLTPNALTGTITFTASGIGSINGGRGFLATDVGRLFRVFSEPPLWAAATTYASGDYVKYADVYWQAVAGSTGVNPDTDNGTNWNISTTAAVWTWGMIKSIVSAFAFTGALIPAVTTPDNVAGGDLLYTTPILAWQLGAYSDTTGYPTVGAYYQGRVWLAGATKNRFDASVSNDFGQNGYINFAPTGRDGTVADNAGISGTLNSLEIEDFLWMVSDEQGVLAGTQSGEWILASSTAGEPITPTSIMAREMTHYGSYNTHAVKVGRATIFVHRDLRKVYEYMANYFTQKFVADNLILKSKHLSLSGIRELAFMRELTPVIWARRGDGGLIGCTYKHDDPIKPMEFNGWHRHALGHGRNVISIETGPTNSGTVDTLSMVTQDADTGLAYVEFLQTIWDQGNALLSAWYVDGGVVPVGGDVLTVNGVQIVRLSGLWDMIGQTVSVWGAGLDLGDYTVSNFGQVDIPVNAEGSLFTTALLFQITAANDPGLGVPVPISGDTSPLTGAPSPYSVPFVVGATFTSRGQILRPLTPAEGATQTGPSLGKLRRMTEAMPLLYDTQGISMGVDFLTMRPLQLISAGRTVSLTPQQLFNGVYKGQVDAESNYDNMWCWEVTRPYPCTVVAVECQLKTNENV